MLPCHVTAFDAMVQLYTRRCAQGNESSVAESWLFERILQKSGSNTSSTSSTSSRRRLTFELLRRKSEDRVNDEHLRVRLKPWHILGQHMGVDGEREFLCAKLTAAEQDELVEQLSLAYQEGYLDRSAFPSLPLAAMAKQAFEMHRRQALFQISNCLKQQLGELERVCTELVHPSSSSSSSSSSTWATTTRARATSCSSLSLSVSSSPTSSPASSPISSVSPITDAADPTSHHHQQQHHQQQHHLVHADGDGTAANDDDHHGGGDDDDGYPDLPMAIIDLKLYLSKLEGSPLDHSLAFARTPRDSPGAPGADGLTGAAASPLPHGRSRPPAPQSRTHRAGRHSWTSVPVAHRGDCPYSKLSLAVTEFLADNSAPKLDQNSLVLLAAQLQLCARRVAGHAGES